MRHQTIRSHKIQLQLVLLTLFTCGCSLKSNKPLANLSYSEAYKSKEAEVKASIDSCLDFKKRVLKLATHEVKRADQRFYLFKKNEEAAKKLLLQFDISKLSHDAEGDRDYLILSYLDDDKAIETYQKHLAESTAGRYREKNCSEMSDRLHFMRGLLYAIEKYSWSKDTKELSKKVFASNLTYDAEQKYPDITGLLADLTLLALASDKNLITVPSMTQILEMKTKVTMAASEYGKKFPKSPSSKVENTRRTLRLAAEEIENQKALHSEFKDLIEGLSWTSNSSGVSH